MSERNGGTKCASAKPSYGERPAKLCATCHPDQGPRSNVTGRSAAILAILSIYSPSFTSIEPERSVTGTSLLSSGALETIFIEMRIDELNQLLGRKRLS